MKYLKHDTKFSIQKNTWAADQSKILKFLPEEIKASYFKKYPNNNIEHKDHKIQCFPSDMITQVK